jgi:hypothetical protein
MGEIISATAKISQVAEHVRSAHQTGMARGGEIAAAAVSRLGPAITTMENAEALQDAAEKAEDAAWALVLAADAKADPGIGDVRDRMWNALGRPRSSPFLDEVYPGGIGTYTAGDPAGQPLLMEVLRARILAGSAPQWTEAMRAGWAAEVEALRVPYAAAMEAYRPLEAARVVAEAGFRAAVRAGHARLRSFKRDLKSLGLTEAQIHEIIPDAGAGKGGSPKGSGDGGGGGGDGGGGG